jgi:hypothetical protein
MLDHSLGDAREVPMLNSKGMPLTILRATLRLRCDFPLLPAVTLASRKTYGLSPFGLRARPVKYGEKIAKILLLSISVLICTSKDPVAREFET